ncbi:MAG: c-type cytochrome [Bacteroidetes bacterium]|nr:c-type cytochrome [Bacteroidota bacterium]
MRTSTRTGSLHLLLLFVSITFLAVSSARTTTAQEFRWPEDPENLKVLPADVKGAKLGQVMRGFASALDVRCEFCHVGEGPNLGLFDFASDEKLNKRKARVMIEMVKAINESHLSELTSLEGLTAERIEVTCITCHRTQNKPVMLDDHLASTIQSDGVDAAITEYRDLRERYYGGFAYDFSEGMLTGLGERLGAEENYDAAIKILGLEIEMNGESPSTFYTLGGVQGNAGLRDEAISTFEKGMELAPDGWRPFFQQEIDRLRQE